MDKDRITLEDFIDQSILKLHWFKFDSRSRTKSYFILQSCLLTLSDYRTILQGIHMFYDPELKKDMLNGGIVIITNCDDVKSVISKFRYIAAREIVGVLHIDKKALDGVDVPILSLKDFSELSQTRGYEPVGIVEANKDSSLALLMVLGCGLICPIYVFSKEKDYILQLRTRVDSSLYGVLLNTLLGLLKLLHESVSLDDMANDTLVKIDETYKNVRQEIQKRLTNQLDACLYHIFEKR